MGHLLQYFPERNGQDTAACIFSDQKKQRGPIWYIDPAEIVAGGRKKMSGPLLSSAHEVS